jgi:hypothetical protein
MKAVRTMPELTRRRSLDAPEECWHIYWGDIRAGAIQIHSGIPFHEDPWGWSCGFYPGSHPGEHEDGTGRPSTRRAPNPKREGARFSVCANLCLNYCAWEVLHSSSGTTFTK